MKKNDNEEEWGFQASYAIENLEQLGHFARDYQYKRIKGNVTMLTLKEKHSKEE